MKLNTLMTLAIIILTITVCCLTYNIIENNEINKELESRIVELENQNHTCTYHTNHTSEIIENSFNDSEIKKNLMELKNQINELNIEFGYSREEIKKLDPPEIEQELDRRLPISTLIK